MSIEAAEISFGFQRDKPILRKISARAEAGRITAIIGPNAVGKTTLLRLLAGLLRTERGEVLLAGQPLGTYTASARAARLAYVAQRSVVDAPFTVRDVLELGGFSLGRREARGGSDFDWVLERCDLGALVNSVFHELSVGQQQRVSLARALVQLRGGGAERVLLLDEPMSALDPSHIEQTGCLLRELAERGTTVLIVLHDLGLAGLLADEVWALQEGAMVAAGPIDSTLTVELLEGMYGNEFQLRETGSKPIAEPSYRFSNQRP